MHRGPRFLVPLGPVPLCPIIASLAGREVGPVFPALSHYRLRPRRDWQERRFIGAEKSLLDEARIDHIARTDVLVYPALRLVPCDLTFNVRDIEPRLRFDKICAGLDGSRATFAAVGINITGNGRRGLMRLYIGSAF